MVSPTVQSGVWTVFYFNKDGLTTRHNKGQYTWRSCQENVFKHRGGLQGECVPWTCVHAAVLPYTISCACALGERSLKVKLTLDRLPSE